MALRDFCSLPIMALLALNAQTALQYWIDHKDTIRVGSEAFLFNEIEVLLDTYWTQVILPGVSLEQLQWFADRGVATHVEYLYDLPGAPDRTTLSMIYYAYLRGHIVITVCVAPANGG